MTKTPFLIAACAVSLLAGSYYAYAAQQRPMTFFVTSTNPGKGGDLGGIEGADAWCATLAKAAGAPATREWHAY